MLHERVVNNALGQGSATLWQIRVIDLTLKRRRTMKRILLVMILAGLAAPSAFAFNPQPDPPGKLLYLNPQPLPPKTLKLKLN